MTTSSTQSFSGIPKLSNGKDLKEYLKKRAETLLQKQLAPESKSVLDLSQEPSSCTSSIASSPPASPVMTPINVTDNSYSPLPRYLSKQPSIAQPLSHQNSPSTSHLSIPSTILPSETDKNFDSDKQSSDSEDMSDYPSDEESILSQKSIYVSECESFHDLHHQFYIRKGRDDGDSGYKSKLVFVRKASDASTLGSIEGKEKVCVTFLFLYLL